MKYRLKIVPDVEPNADGRWIDVTRAPDAFDYIPRFGTWAAVEEYFAPNVPAGEHMVSYEIAS